MTYELHNTVCMYLELLVGITQASLILSSFLLRRLVAERNLSSKLRRPSSRPPRIGPATLDSFTDLTAAFAMDAELNPQEHQCQDERKLLAGLPAIFKDGASWSHWRRPR